jgi:hypothetical protein
MTAKHSASPTSYRAFSHSLGHEDPFPPCWLNVRCVIRHGTFAETNGNGRDAPEAAARVSPIGGVASTRDGRSVWAISV